MPLSDLLTPAGVIPNLRAAGKKAALQEIARRAAEAAGAAEREVFEGAIQRERLGSTGIGGGIAIPHCRSLVVNKLRVAFGRKRDGVDFKAIDEKPVHFFFLIVAPPLEVSNQYLPVLGKIAQFSKEPDVPARLLDLAAPTQFMELLKEKGV